MLDSLHEWLGYFLRWGHLIAGISWIGSSFYFIWLDKALTLPEKPKENVEGEVWMVHSGGFYQVERRKIGPGQMPGTLHWFKWEAAFTWITGVLLMAVVYYAGGGALLFDADKSSSNVTQAVLLSLSLLPVSWLVYDGLWNSFLGKNTRLASGISFLLLVGLLILLSRFFGGRAAYMHMGAIFGTLMVANVWMRILPAQQKMIDATKEGKDPDFSLSAKAKLRSVHNSYLTLPVLFLMLSNHYPMTYGSEHSIPIFLLLFILGASVRHYSITKTKPGLVPALLILASLGGLGFFTLEKSNEESPLEAASLETYHVDPAQSGTLKGTVTFSGFIPVPKKIRVTPECMNHLEKPLVTEEVLVKNGKLQNAFIWISHGLEGKNFSIPTQEVVVDQKGCRYEPRVIGVQVGQPLTFLNTDPFLHNIHSMARVNESFNVSLTNQNQKVTRKLLKPEIMFRSKCDLHPWMSGFIGVVPHPYFAVTNEEGEVDLSQVPAGIYTVSVWHETLGLKEQKVEISPQKTTQIEFSFP